MAAVGAAGTGPEGERPGALSLLQSCLDGIGEPLLVNDREGVIRFANRAALATLGYDGPEDLVGRPCHDTIHYKRPDGSPLPVEECALTRAARAGKPLRSEHDDWFVRRDGSMFPVFYWLAPAETELGHGTIIAFTDLTPRRRLDQAVRERDLANARGRELRAARRRVIEAGDAARRRAARDLHDGAQQRFTIAVMELQRAQQRWSADPAAAKALLDEGLEQAKAGIEELRAYATSLHPQILTHRGLTAAIRSLAATMPLPVTLDLAETGLPAPAEESLYFFVSEALTNVIKHADAGSAAVTIAVADGRVTAEVRDDGAGGAAVAGDEGGLSGLRDRIAAFDGRLTITSAPGRGTLLRAEIPVVGGARAIATPPADRRT